MHTPQASNTKRLFTGPLDRRRSRSKNTLGTGGGGRGSEEEGEHSFSNESHPMFYCNYVISNRQGRESEVKLFC